MTEAALTQSELYSARPSILVDERYIDLVNDVLLSMDFREQENAMSSLELRLRNVASDEQGGAGLAFEQETEFALGSSIRIEAGDEEAQQEIFSGVITGLEAVFPEESPPEILLLAEDVLQNARMTSRTKVYESSNVATLVNDVANQLGIRANVSGLSEGEGPWVQLNESDMAFLKRILYRYGAYMHFTGGQLFVGVSSQSQNRPIELELYSQMRSVKFVADLAHQVTGTTVAGWDDQAGHEITASSSGANLGPGQGRTGAQILDQAMGQRNEHVGQIAVKNDQESQSLADTAFDLRARRFVVAQAVAEGNPVIRVGKNVRLTGTSQRFENTYAVVATRHRYDGIRGYETEFKAQSAYLGYTQ
jgi:phage protein D